MLISKMIFSERQESRVTLVEHQVVQQASKLDPEKLSLLCLREIHPPSGLKMTWSSVLGNTGHQFWATFPTSLGNLFDTQAEN